MKKIYTLALALLATASLTLSASPLTNQNSQNTKEQKECQVKKEMRKGNKGQRHFNPFEGITLSDAQKEQLKALAPAKESKDAKCCQNDSTNCKKKCTPEEAVQKAKDRLGKIKGILTPEQYQQYLENIAVNQMIQHRFAAKKGKGHKEGRPEGRKQREGKGPRNGKKAPAGENSQK